MRVRRGTTGFYEPSETLASIDGKAFQALAYESARVLGATITCIDSQVSAAKNFYEAKIAGKDRRYCLLQNRIHGQLCAARTSRVLPIEFCDVTEIASGISEPTRHDWLASVELESRLEDHELSDLSDAELKQIRYWKPTRLGDLIFNHWDSASRRGLSLERAIPLSPSISPSPFLKSLSKKT